VRDRRRRIFFQRDEGLRRRREWLKRKRSQAETSLDGRKIGFDSGNSKTT
jgi:hypothetical protein